MRVLRTVELAQLYHSSCRLGNLFESLKNDRPGIALGD